MSSKALCSGLLMALLLSACGGSSHSSSSITTTTSAATASSQTTSATTTSTHSKPAPTATIASSTTTQRTTTSTPAAPPPAAGPRVPATYTVLSSGALSPPTISIPTGYTVEVTFIDKGAAQVHAVVHTPKPLKIVAPPGGDAYVLASHLAKGTYAIDINGVARGSLVIGSAPGP